MPPQSNICLPSTSQSNICFPRAILPPPEQISSPEQDCLPSATFHPRARLPPQSKFLLCIFMHFYTFLHVFILFTHFYVILRNSMRFHLLPHSNFPPQSNISPQSKFPRANSPQSKFAFMHLRIST